MVDTAGNQSSVVTKTVNIPVDAATYITGLKGNGQVFADDPASNPRYAGANPNNYINIGDGSLWRIIGVFSVSDGSTTAKRVKIVRDGGIGSYSWDASKWLGSSNSQKINVGYGVNEWSQADAMKLMNPGYDSNSEITYPNGTVVTMNNSLYWNRKSGKCSISWGVQTDACNFSSTGITTTAQGYIGTTVWNTGSNGTTSPYNMNAAAFYNAERGSKTGKICSSPGSGGSCNDTVTRKTSWTGRLALIYPSDYAYSTTGGSTGRAKCLGYSPANWSSYSQCYSNSWIVKTDVWQWTLMPVGDYLNGNRAYLCMYIHKNASSASSYRAELVPDDCMYGVYDMGDTRDGALRPTGYLVAGIKFTGGTGTSSNPYTVSK